MSVETTDNRVTYVGNGVLTVYSYPFQIFEDTDLEVYVDSVLQALTTDYTVSGAENPAGGEITFAVAPANASDVLIARVLPFTQETVYPSNDKFPAKVHEAALDKLTMLVQQLDEVDQRSLKVAFTSAFTDLLVPDPEVGKFLRWSALLSGLENAAITAVGSLGLPVSVADGGTGGATALAARQNLGLDGQVVRQLTNRTGASVAAGNVVALSTANDNSVVLEDTVGSKRIYVVALETISNLAVGNFLVRGVADVDIQGAASVGAYLRKSATSLKAESTGTTQGAAVDPPATALGVTIGAVSGGKARSIWNGIAFPSAAASTVPRGVIAGLTLSNNATDATNDIDIAAGEAASDDTVAANRVWLTGTAMTKQLDAVWAAGSAAGGRISTEAIANGTWHVYAFKRSGGSIDYCFSQSLTPTLPDSGTSKRRIGSILRETAVIVPFVQDGDFFQRVTPVLDINHTNPGASANTGGLSVPTGINVLAHLNVIATDTTSNRIAYISDLAQADLAPSTTAAPLGSIGNSSGGNAWFQENEQQVRTNTLGQIRYRWSASGAATVIRIATKGWFDRRGRDA